MQYAVPRRGAAERRGPARMGRRRRRGRRHAANRRRARRPRALNRHVPAASDYATNVLSFRLRPRQGDIVLCHPVIAREARAQRQDARRALRASRGARRAAPARPRRMKRKRDARRMEAREIRILRAPRFRRSLHGRMSALRMNDPPGPACSSASPRCSCASRATASSSCAAAALGLLAQPARRRRAVDHRGRAHGLRDAGARHHDPARADGLSSTSTSRWRSSSRRSSPPRTRASR